jgi:ABC-type uncharacterized transport system auxiliary subunit
LPGHHINKQYGGGEMRKTTFAAVIALAALAACGKNNETADTTTVPGVDTTAGRAMPTTDTIVKTTTTDTLQGEVPRDSVRDTTKTGTKRP